ncbi:MAG: hypothetical protein NC203_08140 [Firmicutes bacterium]|nr:hypothetical protein [[Eubacterium] siraeum]MCM1488319.1 hypothetical protein [Bacillota bacterium]
MRKFFIIVFSVTAVLAAAFMVLKACVLHAEGKLYFDEYAVGDLEIYPDDKEKLAKMQTNREEGYSIETMCFTHSCIYHDQLLCYNEISDACNDYAVQVANRYDYRADLDLEVEYTPKKFTAKFTGWGYPEEGEPECLDRTYIYDIEGAGPEKLPILLNKDEIYY